MLFRDVPTVALAEFLRLRYGADSSVGRTRAVNAARAFVHTVDRTREDFEETWDTVRRVIAS